jgi:fructose-bisphosphate aldolase class II
MVKTLREYIREAEDKKIAIGHFNISNLEGLKGVYRGVKKVSEEVGYKIPIVIGVSENEEEFIGINEIVILIKEIRDNDNYPIFLNADHHYSFSSVKKCIDIGFDSVIIDATKLSFEENISLTKECVNYAREISKREERDILVESEIGFIGQSSKILEEIPEEVNNSTKTNSEDAEFFVRETGVDLLAPSVGNIHGIVKGGNPDLDIERIREIRNKINVPLVLHGGSGISDEDFIKAIEAGVSIIHISTEIRIAYKEAVLKSLNDNPDELAPYKYLNTAIKKISGVVEKRIRLFNKL